jgi:hypothetical protein
MNDLLTTKHIHYEREVARLSDLLIRNPQAWKEVEARVITIAQEQGVQIMENVTNLTMENPTILKGSRGSNRTIAVQQPIEDVDQD